MKNKILIRENSDVAKLNIAYLEGLKREIESKVISLFEEMNAGNFSTDLLTDALVGNGDKTRKLILKLAEDDLSKIRTPSIRNLVLSDVEKSFEKFNSACERIKSLAEIKMLPYIDIVGNKTKNTPDAEKNIIESCKTYIDSSEELAVYEALQTIIAGCDNFIKAIGKNAKTRLLPHINIYDFINQKEDGKTVLRDDTDISYLAK
jgi:hypothetical protein